MQGNSCNMANQIVSWVRGLERTHRNLFFISILSYALVFWSITTQARNYPRLIVATAALSLLAIPILIALEARHLPISKQYELISTYGKVFVGLFLIAVLYFAMFPESRSDPISDFGYRFIGSGFVSVLFAGAGVLLTYGINILREYRRGEPEPDEILDEVLESEDE